MQSRPTLLGNCAHATSAQEAKFRIDAPIAGPRSVGVVALDRRAAALVAAVQDGSWSAARFYCPAGVPWNGGPPSSAGDGLVAGADLVAADGSPATAAQVVDESDVLVMVATDAAAAGPAGLMGDLADRRGLMTVGVVLADPTETQSVVAAMRPHTRMLMVSRDEADVPEVLRAFRA